MTKTSNEGLNKLTLNMCSTRIKLNLPINGPLTQTKAIPIANLLEIEAFKPAMDSLNLLAKQTIILFNAFVETIDIQNSSCC